jgi:hypothetical protein
MVEGKFTEYQKNFFDLWSKMEYIGFGSVTLAASKQDGSGTDLCIFVCGVNSTVLYISGRVREISMMILQLNRTNALNR